MRFDRFSPLLNCGTPVGLGRPAASGCRSIGALVGIFLLVGCESSPISNAWWNSFLDPTETGNFRENVVHDIQRTISFRDTPPGVAGAVDPTPDDLVATVEEYTLGTGDTLLIRMLDFLQVDAETEIQQTVDELGYIDVPQLGWLHVEGMTARELQAEIIARAKDAGIYHVDESPTVTVLVANQQQRIYNLDGAVRAPGSYRILRPDFRLREAIVQGGGLDETAKVIYISRGGPRHKQIKDRAPTPPRQAGGTDQQQVPPVSPTLMAEMIPSPAGASASDKTAPETSRPSVPGAVALPEDAERELQEALAPSSPAAASPAIPPGRSAEPDSGPSLSTPAPRLPSFIFVNDKFIEAPAPGEPSAETPPAAPPTPGPQAGPGRPPAALPSSEPVDWEALAAEDQHRVIRIPADKLRSGDPNYDIVIRHQDWIRVDPGPTGLYYMDGHVSRPGPYSLSGEEITLTQAIAAAGGFDPLAWPTRCEIRRRLDGDREEITQWDLARILDGRDPDLFIKRHDVIRVGTHAVAPFLFTLRNAFRLTYGFGFIYDRNFADIDAYGGDINPKLRRRQEREQLFQRVF